MKLKRNRTPRIVYTHPSFQELSLAFAVTFPFVAFFAFRWLGVV